MFFLFMAEHLLSIRDTSEAKIIEVEGMTRGRLGVVEDQLNGDIRRLKKYVKDPRVDYATGKRLKDAGEVMVKYLLAVRTRLWEKVMFHRLDGGSDGTIV